MPTSSQHPTNQAFALRAISRELYAPTPTLGHVSRLPSPPPFHAPNPDTLVGLVGVLWAIGISAQRPRAVPPSAHIGAYDRINIKPGVGQNLSTHA